MENSFEVVKPFDGATLKQLENDADIVRAYVEVYRNALLKEYSDLLRSRLDTVLNAYSSVLEERLDAASASLADSCARLKRLIGASLESGELDVQWHDLSIAAAKGMGLRPGREVQQMVLMLNLLPQTFGTSLVEGRASDSNADRRVWMDRCYGGLEQGCLFGAVGLSLRALRAWLNDRLSFARTPEAVVGDATTAPAGASHLPQPSALRPFCDGPSLGFRAPARRVFSLAEPILPERAGEEHEVALQALRRQIVDHGIDCFESTLIDLAFVRNEVIHVVEVKSITENSERDQVRAAFAQLHDYCFVYRDVTPFVGCKVSMWVMLAAPPVNPWTRAFLRDGQIGLVWLDSWGVLAGPDLNRLGVDTQFQPEIARSDRAVP